MTSTLFVRKTPKKIKNEFHFKQPVKGIIGKKFFEHDGSLGGNLITIGSENLEWFEGVIAAATNWNEKEYKDFVKVLEILSEGDSIDMWFEA